MRKITADCEVVEREARTHEESSVSVWVRMKATTTTIPHVLSVDSYSRGPNTPPSRVAPLLSAAMRHAKEIAARERPGRIIEVRVEQLWQDRVKP